MMRIDYNTKIWKMNDQKVLTLIRALDEYIININESLAEERPGLIYDENMKLTNYGRELKADKLIATDLVNKIENERS